MGSDLIRVIRRLALVEQRLKLVEKEINSLQESELYELEAKAEDAEGSSLEYLARSGASPKD